MLRAFFSYYGSKRGMAHCYPEPVHEYLVEPFAGGAGYALQYWQKKVILVELDPVIAGIWDYLIRVKEEEIRSLPLKITNLRDMDLPQEQKWLIGFCLGPGSMRPRLTVPKTNWHEKRIVTNNPFWSRKYRGRIASQLKYIRHWRVYNKSYEHIPNVEATWYVDPPYQGPVGRFYKYNKVDYTKLGEWCRSRKGQVIVCEQAGADWLPFRPFTSSRTCRGKKGGKTHSKEVIWTNSDVCGLGFRLPKIEVQQT